MKRLWAFVSVAILLIGILGVFDTQKASAQGIDRQAESGNILNKRGTYDYFQGVITSYHSTAMAAFDRNSGGTLESSTETVAKAVAAYKTASQKNYDAYLSVFNAEKEKGTAPADAQILGIRAWVNSMNNQVALTRPYTGPLKSAYDQYAKEVQNAAFTAEQIKRGIIDADSYEAAVQQNPNTITNAAAGNTNQTKQVMDSNPSECSLLNGNLIGCVNSLVAWLIKVTFLQIAGFLVWLTANMLNFAIQISILDFSKWAPDSLYPIWIVVRQIISLFVVFAGLYLGFMYIIGRTEAFGKYVGWLIIFALFVNFSYPFSRALIDVSNIVSLNVYTASVGKEVLTGSSNNTAGTIIMNKLGLQGLMTNVLDTKETGFVGSVNTVPGALIAVAFVLYAAYIFFMATAIIAIRTAVLVFLTVASPLLLVDSVVPKLGDAAVKMRKMFFEQLAVAPVFMIMLALTLKFMDIFQLSGGPLSNINQSQAMGALGASGNVASTQAFFSILMMLVMLHITLKVTKSLAGEAGQAATNFMGKVGGFGLAAATMGTGVLARGTVGAGAARLRDSAWMDRLQGSAAGRGLYTLSNSLAQSTYDARNVSMVSKGMAKAGLTGGLGLTMQNGIKQGFDERKKSRTDEVIKLGSTIQDDTARSAYFSKVNAGRLVKVDTAAIREAEREVQSKRESQLTTFAGLDKERRASMMNQAIIAKDYALQEKLKAGEEYLSVNNSSPDAAKQKAVALKKFGNDKLAEAFFKNDPLRDIQENYNEEIKSMEERLSRMKRGTEEEKKLYDAARVELENKKKDHKDFVEGLKKETRWEYTGGVGPRIQTTKQGPQKPSPDNDSPPSGGLPPNPSQPNSMGPIPSHPGGSDFSRLDQNDHPKPIVNREQPKYSKVAEIEMFDPRTMSFKERREAAARAAQRNMGETPQQTGQEAVAA